MQKLRKFLVIGVMVLTVLGMTGLVAPTAKAAASAGDLIKMAGNSSVYYLGSDGKRYVFPNSTTYFSWYSDFSGVVTIPASELQSYPLGGNVTMRAGTKLVKITTDPSVYAVEPNGTLRKIQSEAQAAALYGTDWAKRVVDVPDAFFVNYKIGSALTDGAVPAGSLVKNAGSASVYYYDGTNYRMVASEAAFNANRFMWSNVLTVSSTITAGGTAVSNAETALINVAQGSGSAPVSTGSGVMVSLSSNTPMAKNVPSNATGVVMASYNFTASNDGSVVLEHIMVKRTGVGSPSEFSKVYLYEGNTRLTNGRTVSSSDNTATFSSLNYTIPAGTTKTISVVADVANAASGSHAFSLEAASAVTAGGANVSGSFPVVGNTMSFSTTSVGLTDVEGNNTYTVKAGETNVEVGRFTVYVSNTEDATINGVTLYNGGRDVLSNLKLYRGSDLVATGVKNGSYFIFTLANPINVVKGENVAFNVMGDVTGARDGDTATLTVRYNTDLQVMGKTYGYNLKPADAALGGVSVGTNGSSMIEELGSQKQTINVEAGQVTLTFNGPVTSNVAKNSKDVVLMNFAISAQSALDVEKVGIIVKDSDAAAGDLVNAEIVCGSTIMNEWASFTDDASETLTDTSVWSIAAGETKNCQIRVDVENNKDANDTISADLDISNWTFKDSNTGDTITDVVPSADLVGNTMTVVAASLTGALSSTPAAQTWVSGSNVEVNGYNFVAGDAKAVKVTAISLKGYIDANVDGTFAAGQELAAPNTVYVKDVLSTIELYDGTTKVGTTKTVATDGTVTFNTLSWNIPAGATKQLVVKGLTSNNAPYGGTDDAIKFAVTSVTAEYDNGTGVTPTITAIDEVGDITISQRVTGAGTLSMAIDADTPASALLVMGNQGVALTKVKFTTTKEPFTIEKLQVKSGGSADADVTGVTIEYKNEAGATVTSTGFFSGGVVNFSGLSIYVPKDDSSVVTLKADLNTKTGGATNGNTVALDADYDTNFRAVSKNSSTVVTSAGSADAAGNDMFVFESKPAVNFAADTPSGNLVPSANTLLAKIAVTADASKDISFENIGKRTITVGGTALAGGEDPASANVVVPTSVGGTANIAVDIADGASNNAIATAIAAAIDAHADWSASAATNVVTMTAASKGTWSNTAVNTAALVAAIDAADVSDDDTTLTDAQVTGGNNSLTVQLALTRADDATGDDDALTLKDEAGDTLDSITGVDFDTAKEHVFDFSSKSFTVAAGTTKYLYVYGTTTDFEDQGDSIQVWLDDVDGDIDWGINGAGSYNKGNIIFKGDKFGGTFVKP